MSWLVSPHPSSYWTQSMTIGRWVIFPVQRNFPSMYNMSWVEQQQENNSFVSAAGAHSCTFWKVGSLYWRHKEMQFATTSCYTWYVAILTPQIPCSDQVNEEAQINTYFFIDERCAGYRTEFLRKFEPMIHSKSTDGFYINSCFSHCQSQLQSSWFAPESPRLFNTVCTSV